MEKVKVSREVATFIEDYENNVASVPGWEDSLIIDHSRNWYEDFQDARVSAMCMKDIPPLKLSKILIYGYEIEKTPEEILLDHFTRHRRSAIKSSYSRGVADGITMALARLGIEVKGITSK